jgi:thiazole synthase ThiGH ThiG subunit
MKLTVPGILITALIVASPAAFAQGTGYSGTSSNPAVSVSKDETTSMTKRSKKRVASHKKKHQAKPMSSQSQTTGSGSSSGPKY